MIRKLQNYSMDQTLNLEHRVRWNETIDFKIYSFYKLKNSKYFAHEISEINVGMPTMIIPPVAPFKALAMHKWYKSCAQIVNIELA